MAELDFDRKEFEEWLRSQPVDVSVVISARAALRSLPELQEVLLWRADAVETIVLPLLRALSSVCLWCVRDLRNVASLDEKIADYAENTTLVALDAILLDASSRGGAAAASAISQSVQTTVCAIEQDSNKAAKNAVDSLVSSIKSARSVNSNSNIQNNIEKNIIASIYMDREIFSELESPDEALNILTKRIILSSGEEKLWFRFKKFLLSLDPNWSVWTDWYDDRLAGKPAIPDLDVARVTLLEEFWKKGAKFVNAELKRIRDGLPKSDEAAASNAATTVTETDFLSATTDGERGSDSCENAGELYPETVEFAPSASEATQSDPEPVSNSTVENQRYGGSIGAANEMWRVTKHTLIAQAPVSAVIEDGKVGARDSPPDSKPPVDHPEDLEQRLQAQSALAGKLVATLTEMPHNLGPYLARDLSHFQRVTEHRLPVWYALDDAAQDLRNHLILLEDLSWPGTTRQSVERLCRRTEELRPLLQPRQPESDPSKPEIPEPALNPDRASRDALEEIFESIGGMIQADGGRVLGPTFVEATEHYTQEAQDALETSDTSETGEVVKQRRLSRAFRGLAGLLGSGALLIATGVATNALTVPEAAVTVGQRFTEIFEFLARLFS